MDPFDRMYGKACLQVQIVLHVDSSSGLKTKLTFQFPGLCLRSSAGRTDTKLIGVFAQEKHCTWPWPNPQHHKWKNHLEGGHQPNSCPMVEYQGRDLWMEGNQCFHRKTWGLCSQLWEFQSPWHPVLCLIILWLYLQEFAEDPTLHTRRAERESCALLWSSLFPLRETIYSEPELLK